MYGERYRRKLEFTRSADPVKSGQRSPTVALKTLVNEARHHAMFMCGAQHLGNTSRLGCEGGLAGSLLKKKDKVTEERADVLNILEQV